MNDNSIPSPIKLILTASPSVASMEDEEIFLGSINLDTPRFIAQTPKEFLEFIENHDISGSWRTEVDWESSCIRSKMKLYGVSVQIEFSADI